MFDIDLWAEIFYSIRKNKLRTFLTGFSVAWGIFILVMLLASVKGMQNGFTKQFSDNASNMISIAPSVTKKAYAGFEAGKQIRFKNSDYDFIKGSFKDEVEYISPVFTNQFNVKYKKETGIYPVIAVNEQIAKIEGLKLKEGRFLIENDIINKKKVVVVGVKIEKDLFPSESPLGKMLLINNSAYTVIGVFEDNGNDYDEQRIYTPITTMQQIYGNTNQLNEINLTYNPSFSFSEAINFSDVLEVVLKRRHNIHPDDQGAIYLSNSAERFSGVSNFTKVLQGISIGVGILILLSGIVGIGNILVFIIKERTKEIGIRKALGAKPLQVVNLVILESVFITMLSGVVGMFFSMFIVNFVGKYINTPAFTNPSVDVKTIIIALIILVVSGVLAGLIPAMKAANLKPIVALRSE